MSARAQNKLPPPPSAARSRSNTPFGRRVPSSAASAQGYGVGSGSVVSGQGYGAPKPELPQRLVEVSPPQDFGAVQVASVDPQIYELVDPAKRVLQRRASGGTPAHSSGVGRYYTEEYGCGAGESEAYAPRGAVGHTENSPMPQYHRPGGVGAPPPIVPRSPSSAAAFERLDRCVFPRPLIDHVPRFSDRMSPAAVPRHLRSSSYCGSVSSTGSRRAPRRQVGATVLEHVNLGAFLGRAGALQLYLITFDVPYTPVVVPSEPRQLRERMQRMRLRRGGVPIPQWPVLYIDKHGFVGVNATLRYLARTAGQYGSFETTADDARRDYMADMILDRLSWWRDCLSQVIGEHPFGFDQQPLESNPEVVEYYNSHRNVYFKEVEELLEYADSDFLLQSPPEEDVSDDTENINGMNPGIPQSNNGGVSRISWIDPYLFSLLVEDEILTKKISQGSSQQAAAGRPNSARGGNNASSAEFEGIRSALRNTPYETFLQRFPRILGFKDKYLRAAPKVAQWIQEHHEVFGAP